MRAAENHPHSRVTRRAHPLDQGAAMELVVEAEFDVSKGVTVPNDLRTATKRKAS